MAINRFYAPGQSQYVSQYVPYKLPFELWQQKVQQADQNVDLAKQQLSTYDPQVLGLKELGIPESERDYYGGTAAAITQKFGSLAAQDYQLSLNSANQFNQKLDQVTDNDFVMKAASGDIADEFIKLNQLYRQHQNQNAVFQQRLDWKKKADEQLASKADDVTSSPYLMKDFVIETRKMEQDPFYVPTTAPVIGKSIDRTKELLGQVDALKDSGSTRYDFNNPLYLTWKSNKGVSADKYAAFAFDILSDPNSAIRRDIELQVDSQIQTGDLDPAMRDVAINAEINNLVDVSRNLQHNISDQGASAKSEFTYTKENEGTAIPTSQEINAYGPPTTLNQVGNQMQAYSTYVDQLTTKLNNLTPNTPAYNQAKLELSNAQNKMYELQAQYVLGDIQIKGTYDPNGTRNSGIQQREALSVVYQNPNLINQVIYKDENGEYHLDRNKLLQLSQGVPQDQIQTFEAIINDEIQSDGFEQKLSTYKDKGIALQVYQNYDTRATIDDKKQLLSSLGVNILDKSNADINNLYDSYNTKGYKVNEEIKATNVLRQDYNSGLEAMKNDPVNQNKFDYYTTTTITRPVTNQEFGNISRDLDVTNSKIVLPDGTVKNDPRLLQTAANGLYESGNEIISSTTVDGKIITKYEVSALDLMTPEELQLELSKQGLEDPKEAQAYINSLKNQKVTVDVHLQGNNTSYINKNSTEQIIANPDLDNYTKTTEVTKYQNSGSYKNINTENNKLIVGQAQNTKLSTGGSGTITGYNTYQTTDTQEYSHYPKTTIPIYVVDGNEYQGAIDVYIDQVTYTTQHTDNQGNIKQGEPQFIYKVSIDGGNFREIALPTPDSQALTDYLTQELLSNQ